VPKRAPYYEDHAKPAWISAPVMAIAAAALLVGGHLLSRRAGALVAAMMDKHREGLEPPGVILLEERMAQRQGESIP